MGKRRRKDWEIWQDGMCVAKSSGAADAFHYAMIYSQDGPVQLKPPHGVSLSDWINKFNAIAEPATKE